MFAVAGEAAEPDEPAEPDDLTEPGDLAEPGDVLDAAGSGHLAEPAAESVQRRTLSVAAARVPRWVAGFVARHGCAGVSTGPQGFTVTGVDGARAELVVPFGPWNPPADAAAQAERLAVALSEHVLVERRLGVLLVRRGGYGCAVLAGERILQSKVGGRYVQGRTAAGGWSQQRFARRREKQTGELAGAAAEVAERLLVPTAGLQALVTGGDRPLVERVLAEPRLRPLARLPRGPHLPVGDPRAEVIRAVAGMLRSVRIELAEPAGLPGSAPPGAGAAGSRQGQAGVAT